MPVLIPGFVFKSDHKYRLSFSFWSWPLSEGLSTAHAVSWARRQGVLQAPSWNSAGNRSGTHSSFLRNSFLMANRAKTKDLEKVRSWDHETVVAAGLVPSLCSLWWTSCRKERPGRQVCQNWSLTWKFKKLLNLGFVTPNNWEVYSADNLRVLSYTQSAQIQPVLDLHTR